MIVGDGILQLKKATTHCQGAVSVRGFIQCGWHECGMSHGLIFTLYVFDSKSYWNILVQACGFYS